MKAANVAKYWINSVKYSYLHIGMPKTGTTAIQRAVGAQNRDHWLCLFLGDGSIDQLMVRRFRITRERAEQKKREQISLLERAESGAVFSTEFLYDHARKDAHIEALASLFDKYFDKTTVVLYVRDQLDHMPSVVSQRIKAGQKHWEKAFHIDHFGYNYEAICDMWGNHFELIVKDYGRCGDVVSDFCDTVGRPAPPEQDLLNSSFGAKKLDLLIKINQCAAPELERERRKVVDCLGELNLTETRLRLPIKVREELERSYADANLSFAAKYLEGRPLKRKS